MRVLAVTTHRASEVAEPVEHMDAEAEVVVVDSSAGLLWRDYQVLVGSLRGIRRHDPEIVLLDCYESMGFLVTLLCLLYGVPTVCRLPGDNWRTIGEEEVRVARTRGAVSLLVTYLSLYLNLFIYARADGFVVVSEELREVVADRTACPRDRIEVVHVPVKLGMEGDASAAREDLDVREDTVLLTVTNLRYRPKLEGVKTILEELRGVLEDDDDLAYVVAGGGFYHADLCEHLDESITVPDVRRRIYAPGWVPNIHDVYALADVFVYVSYLDGYPNAVIEAQAAGLPVVANAAHGMVEQIEHGTTGLLVDPSRPGDLESQVRRLLADGGARSRYGRAARETVMRENSPEAIGRRLTEALERIAERLP